MGRGASSNSFSPAWPEPRASPASSRRPAVFATFAALAIAITAELVLPASDFRARALVSVVDGSSSAAPVLLKAAGDTAVSKSVIARAAESLIGTAFSVPEPGFVERFEVAFDLGAHASSGEARLASDLSKLVTARPAEAPGTLEIAAEMPGAEQAAQVATAVAQSLIAEHDLIVMQTRHQREVASAEQLKRLAAEAAAARRRLAELGGLQADPAQVRAAATAQVAALQGQVDSLHAIIASGSPPLSDGRAMPSPIQGLQDAYLDVARQLAKAQQTLGERHTTVIALHDEVQHAAASLTAEWKRLAHVTETELGVARERERAAVKAEANAGSASRGAIDDARLAVQVADDRIAHAEQVFREVPDEERSYRLLSAAAVPQASSGLDSWLRLPLVALFGLAAFWATLSLSRARPVGHEQPIGADEDGLATPTPPRLRWAEAVPASRKRSAERVSAWDEPRRAPRPASDVTAIRRAANVARPEDSSALQDRLRALRSEYGTVPTLLVAANETRADTMSAALAIGRAAATNGMRVLLVEDGQTKADLANASDPDADPIVVDLFGTLRVALPADVSVGALHLAPNFQQGKRIASALVANRETRLVDDVVDAFDLMIVDGGRASARLANWNPDALLRVGTGVSSTEDERLAASLDVLPTLLIGTYLTSQFVANEDAQREDAWVDRVEVPIPQSAMRPRSSRSASPMRASSARAMPSQRKVGAR